MVFQTQRCINVVWSDPQRKIWHAHPPLKYYKETRTAAKKLWSVPRNPAFLWKLTLQIQRSTQSWCSHFPWDHPNPSALVLQGGKKKKSSLFFECFLASLLHIAIFIVPKIKPVTQIMCKSLSRAFYSTMVNLFHFLVNFSFLLFPFVNGEQNLPWSLTNHIARISPVEQSHLSHSSSCWWEPTAPRYLTGKLNLRASNNYVSSFWSDYISCFQKLTFS